MMTIHDYKVPGQGPVIYEYFPLLSPPAEVKRIARQKKERLHREIGLSEQNRWAVPHITLRKFLSDEPDTTVRLRLTMALWGFESFYVENEKLHVFDHKTRKSIVVLFKKHDPINKLQKLLSKSIGLSPVRMTPHLTIARSVPNHDFNKISQLDNYFFKGGFLCDRVTILRRPAGSNSRYENFYEIMLS